MKAEIICVGTELLLGDIVNTNAQYISKELSALGISVYNQQVVGDNPARLKEAALLAKQRSDIVIYSGGLGPTDDDLTKQTVAEVYNDKLVYNRQVFEKISRYFAKTGRPLTENNKKQAYVPEKGRFLDNDLGTAPGIVFMDGEKLAILLPGVPFEMEAMMREKVSPLLAKLVKGVILSRYVNIIGIGESALEEKISILLSGENPTVALYAKDGEVQVRITALAADRGRAENMLNDMQRKLESLAGEYIYGIDQKNIETVIVNRLLRRGQSVATAESCTGGSVSARLTGVSGASGAFKLGVCAYTEEQKQSMLGVSGESIDTYTAVSSQVACEMAAGVLQKSGADYAVSTTGYAGPGGGTPQEPVGTVYVAVAHMDKIYVKKCFFTGTRERITHMAAQNALNLLRCVMFSLPLDGVRVEENEEFSFDEELYEERKSPSFLKVFFTVFLLLTLSVLLAVTYLCYQNGGRFPIGDLEIPIITKLVTKNSADVNTVMAQRRNIDFFDRGFEGNTLKTLSRLTAQNPDIKGWITFKNGGREYPVYAKKQDSGQVFLPRPGNIADYKYISGFTGENFPDVTNLDTVRENAAFVYFEDGRYTDYQIFSVGTFSGEDLAKLTEITDRQEYIVQIRARSLFDVDVVVRENEPMAVLLVENEPDKYVACFAVKGNRSVIPSVDVKMSAVYSDWYMRENNLTDDSFAQALLYAQEIYDRDNWRGLSPSGGSANSSSESNSRGQTASSRTAGQSSKPISSRVQSSAGAQHSSSQNTADDSVRQTPTPRPQPAEPTPQPPEPAPRPVVPTPRPAVPTPEPRQSQEPPRSGEEILTVTMNGQVVSGPASQILSQIVAIEMSSSWNPEALKAQAVATHTYLEYEYARGVSAPAVSGRTSPAQNVVNAVSQVSDLIMTVNGAAVYTPYTASVAGYTNPPEQVWGTSHSHLKTVESKYDYLSPGYEKSYTFTAQEMKDIVDRRVGTNLDLEKAAEWFSVVDYTDGGYIRRLKIGDATTYTSKSGNTRNITGYWFATDILADAGRPLRSAAFTVDYADGVFTITTKGYGHGVGLSQWGAQLYAQHEGWNYEQILTHYYTGVSIQKK